MMVEYQSKLLQSMKAQPAAKTRNQWKNDYPRNPQKHPRFLVDQMHHSSIEYPQYNICYSIKHYLNSFPPELRNDQLEFATVLQDKFLELPLSDLAQLIQTHLRHTCVVLKNASTMKAEGASDGAEITQNLPSSTLPEWQQVLIEHIENYQFNVIFLGALQTLNGYMSVHCIPLKTYLVMIHALFTYAIKLLSSPDKFELHINAALGPLLCQFPQTWISFLNGHFPELKLECLNLRAMLKLIQWFDKHLRDSKGVDSSHIQFLEVDTLLRFPTGIRLNCDDPYNRAPNNADQMVGQVLLARHLGTSEFVNDPAHIAELVKLMKGDAIVHPKAQSTSTQQEPINTQQAPTDTSPTETKQPLANRPQPTTKQPPTHTQQTPTKTQEPPTKTQLPPTSIQQPPTSIQQPPANSPQSPANSPQPPANIPQPPAKIPQLGTKTQQPPIHTQQPHTRTQPPTRTQQPSANTPQPPANTQQPPAKTQLPSTKTQQPPAKTQPPPIKAQSPPTKTQQSPAKTQQLRANNPQPPTNSPQPPSNTLKPPAKTPQLPTKIQQPPIKTQQPPTTQQPSTKTQQLPVKTPQPLTKAQQPPANTPQPPTKTQQTPTKIQLPPAFIVSANTAPAFAFSSHCKFCGSAHHRLEYCSIVQHCLDKGYLRNIDGYLIITNIGCVVCFTPKMPYIQTKLWSDNSLVHYRADTKVIYDDGKFLFPAALSVAWNGAKAFEPLSGIDNRIQPKVILYVEPPPFHFRSNCNFCGSPEHCHKYCSIIKYCLDKGYLLKEGGSLFFAESCGAVYFSRRKPFIQTKFWDANSNSSIRYCVTTNRIYDGLECLHPARLQTSWM
ncbi:hypothetical protein TRVA0_058S00232 [Trichomonascus vanleenenianus]|uniref:uncharacterized protein n=1 Tax=Trichomonascus vanleenenianus TaxID=2268995 RepID=UPI003ECB1EC4